MVRGNTRGESYSRLVSENQKRLYYAHTSGKVGYVDKRKIDPITKEVKDDYIIWLKPFVFKKHGKLTCFIRIGKKKLALKNLIAKTFISGYSCTLHAVINLDGNIKNCSVGNLALVRRGEQKASDMANKITVVSPNGKIISYDSLLACSASLCVHPNTLWNYLHQRVCNGVLSVYTFYIGGEPIEPKKKICEVKR